MSAASVTASPKNPNSGKAFAADAELPKADAKSGGNWFDSKLRLSVAPHWTQRVGNESARHSLALMCGANLLLAAAPPRPGAVMALGAFFLRRNNLGLVTSG